MTSLAECLAESKVKYINNTKLEDSIAKDIEDWYMKTIVRGFNKHPFYSIFQIQRDKKEYHVYVRLNVHTDSPLLPTDRQDITTLLCPQQSRYINKVMKQYPVHFYIHQFETTGKEIYLFNCEQD